MATTTGGIEQALSRVRLASDGILEAAQSASQLAERADREAAQVQIQAERAYWRALLGARAAGATYQQIADTLGLSRQRAHKLCERATDEVG